MNKKVLVTGGLGYIGSHTAVELIQAGYHVEIIDNMSNGTKAALDRIEEITSVRPGFAYVDLRQANQVDFYFSRHKPDYIIHFAALKSVEESVADPIGYYQNNVVGLVNLLSAINRHKTPLKRFVFSSSCTVYDAAAKMPVTEESPLAKSPASPYGATKIACEQILQDWSIASEIEVDILRYFNPAGAHESGLLGEVQKVKRNLFPVIMNAIVDGKAVTVYGDDYPTRDGSCVRDYIHVSDLADAHIKAMEHKHENTVFTSIYNLGSSGGYTVKEIIHECRSLLQKEVKMVIGPRRDGDMPAIWADCKKTQDLLGWEPKRGVADIVRTAWKWEENYINEGKGKDTQSKPSRPDNEYITGYEW